MKKNVFQIFLIFKNLRFFYENRPKKLEKKLCRLLFPIFNTERFFPKRIAGRVFSPRGGSNLCVAFDEFLIFNFFKFFILKVSLRHTMSFCFLPSLFSFPFIVFQPGRRFQSAVRRFQAAGCRSQIAGRKLQVPGCSATVAMRKLKCDSCNAKVAVRQLQCEGCSAKVAVRRLQCEG